MALITYIGHSGFLVEWEHCVWLFDYYQGKIPEFDHGKRLFVFCSHVHSDHFNPEVFRIFATCPDVKYVFSEDISGQVKELSLTDRQKGCITYLKAYEDYNADDGADGAILVQTLNSTDCGVAFLITYETKTFRKQVYHAGDLNWWIWKGETKQEIEDMTARFQAEIEQLREWVTDLEIAFIPLDPRQEDWYHLGMDWFMEHLGAKYVFPMHLWRNLSLIQDHKALDETKPFAGSIMEITGEGQRFEI